MVSFCPAFATRDDTYDDTASRSACAASDGVDHNLRVPESTVTSLGSPGAVAASISTFAIFVETVMPVSIGALRATDVPAVLVDATGCGTPVDVSNSGVTGMVCGSDCCTDACIAAMGFNKPDTCVVGDATTELGSALD